MKNSKRNIELDDEDEMNKRNSANTAAHRRPHKNLVRYWQEHTEDYDEIDEFFAK